MRFTLYKLKPKSSFHLGERENIREGTEVFIHSDTLFSAFCHSYFLLYGKEKLESLLSNFLKNNPPFLISSVFPFWEGKIYFPVPLNQIPGEKKYKKVLFVEKLGFERLLSGEDIKNIFTSDIKTIPSLKIEKERDKRPYETREVPRVGLNRLTNHPGENYFHFGEVYYREDSGLFFLIDFKDNSIKKEFKATLRLVADEGIGGDRTVGKGLFELINTNEIDINIPQNADGIVSLSLYYPKEGELLDVEDSYYEIIERKGYIYSPYVQSLRRKSVRMFKEGSVFKTVKTGKIADVTPETFKIHRIYRYGLCFGLPCKRKVER